jgi:ankyrin repeat protein
MGTSIAMLQARTQILVALATTIATAAFALASPLSSNAMPTIKPLFFPSGIQKQLEVAVRSNDPMGVDQLLSTGAQVNARGLHGVTPLMIAVDAQTPRAVAALLRAGANPNLKAADGAGAVHLAVESHAVAPSGHDILAMVMNGGGDPNTLRPDRDPVIVRFTYDHDLDDLRWFHSIGADFDIRARTDRPLIADVAYAQNWDSVWVMIELGARYDYEDTAHPLSKALNTPYGSSPDSLLYPYKLKFWQLLKDHGIAVAPWKTVAPPGAH